MPWDVMGGVARRAWARNEHAMEVSAEYNEEHSDLGHITLPYCVDPALIERLIAKK